MTGAKLGELSAVEYVMSCLLHALPRHHPSPEYFGTLPADVNESDNIFLHSPYVKGKLWKKPKPNFLDIWSSHLKTS